MSQPDSVSLYFTEGSSDKVYNVQLEKDATGWSVFFQYGRRGKPLTSGDKGTNLPFEAARKAYDALVTSKTKKGYTPDVSGAVFTSSEFAGRDTGFRPQLLNEIDHEDAAQLGDDWLAQEKHDGERLTILNDENGLRFANKKGLEINVPEPIHAAFSRMAEVVGDFIYDAENMGGYVVVFDVPKHFMIQEGTFEERASILQNTLKTVLNNGLASTIHVDVPTPLTHFFAVYEEKLREGGAEGYVMRKKDSIYTAGRPNSGGDALKVKYWADVSCRVCPGREGKQSTGIELLDDQDQWVQVGNVTLPASVSVEVGEIIDVKYLYAYAGGSIYQPSFLKKRSDVDPSECRMDRLKIKVDRDIRIEDDSPEP